MIIRTLISSFFLIAPLLQSHEFTFAPPSGWKIVPPKENSPIGFIGPVKRGFAPSMNYLVTPLSLSEESYVKGVIERYAAIPENEVVDLGVLELGSVRGHLLQIDQKKPFGQIRVWQLLIIEGARAHLLTYVCQKESFESLQKMFKNTFSSIRFLDDLFELTDRKKVVETAISLKKDKKMLKFLQKHYQELGPFWQAQCLAKLKNLGYLQ